MKARVVVTLKKSVLDPQGQAVGRALDLFGLAWKPVRRWGVDVGPTSPADGQA